MPTYTKTGTGAWGAYSATALPPAAGYDFYGPLDGSLPAGSLFSSFGGGGGPSNTGSYSFFTPGVKGQALRLSTAATTLSGSQGASFYLPASIAYSGYSGTGTQGFHQEKWYSLWFHVPTGWHVPADTGNWIWEWHDDTTSINELNGFGKSSVSCAIGAYGITNPPTWLYQLNGGPTNNPNYSGRVPTSIPIVPNTWYRLLAHFIWDVDPAVGQAQIYVSADRGATWSTIVDQNRATLFRRTDGSWSYNTHGMYCYHLSANYNVDQDFDEWYIGPTRASVLGL